MFAILLLIAVSLCFVQFSRVQQVPGWLTTTRGLVLVQPFRAGVVESVRVAEGQLVKPGDVLATVRIEEMQPDIGGTPQVASLAYIAQQDGWLKQQIDITAQQTEEDRKRLQDQISMLHLEIADLDAQIVQQQVVAAVAHQDADAGKSLAEQGYLPQREASNRQSAWAVTVRDLAALRERRAALGEQMSAAENALGKLDTDKASKIADLQGSRAALLQHRAETQGERLYALTAPIAGRVSNLSARPGYPADTKRPLLAIVPQGAALEAELFVPSSAAAFIRPSQEVRLLFDAFPFERFGSQAGHIKIISGNAILPTDVAAPVEIKEPVYLASVTLDQQAVQAFGSRVPLQPGMTLRADVILEHRSLFEWIFEPLFAVKGRL